MIECLAVASLTVLNDAVPPLSATVPSFVPPSVNVTVPVGRRYGRIDTTEAVKVTDWPKTEGFADDTTEVVVLSSLTICVTVPALVLKLPSPL